MRSSDAVLSLLVSVFVALCFSLPAIALVRIVCSSHRRERSLLALPFVLLPLARQPRLFARFSSACCSLLPTDATIALVYVALMRMALRLEVTIAR